MNIDYYFCRVATKKQEKEGKRRKKTSANMTNRKGRRARPVLCRLRLSAWRNTVDERKIDIDMSDDFMWFLSKIIGIFALQRIVIIHYSV